MKFKIKYVTVKQRKTKTFSDDVCDVVTRFNEQARDICDPRRVYRTLWNSYQATLTY